MLIYCDMEFSYAYLFVEQIYFSYTTLAITK